MRATLAPAPSGNATGASSTFSPGNRGPRSAKVPPRSPVSTNRPFVVPIKAVAVMRPVSYGDLCRYPVPGALMGASGDFQSIDPEEAVVWSHPHEGSWQSNVDT